MLRISVAAALVILTTSAFAQSMEEIKGAKPGVGCVGPISKVAIRLDTCLVEGSKTRIWCPNGKVFDRNVTANDPHSYVVRSICELNQIL
jgi:hypothetical protein